MSNRVVVTLDLKDNASPGLRKFKQAVDQINTSVKGLTQSVDGATARVNKLDNALGGLNSKTVNVGVAGRNAFTGFSGSIAGGIIQAQLLTSALGAVSNTVGRLVGLFNDASDASSQALTATAGFMSLAGMSFDEATSYVNDFTKAMAVAAAPLPGETAGYVRLGQSISDNLIPAFQDLNGVLDKQGLSEYLKSISQSGGVIAAMSQVDAAKAGADLAKALGGNRSLNQIKELQFFEVNPAVTSLIEQEANKLGKDLKEMTDRERADVIKTALERATPPEVLEAAKNSVPGLIAGFTSQLFDPYTGIFGWLRDTNLELKGDQSAFEAVRLFLKALVGDGGLFDTIKSIAEQFNLTDPMASIRENILGLRDRVNRFNLWLRGVNRNLDDLDRDGNTAESARSEIRTLLTDAIKSIGRKINSFFENFARDFNLDGAGLALDFNAVLAGLKEFDFGKFFSAIGLAVAKVINAGGDFIANTNWADVGIILVNATGGLIKGIAVALLNIDPKIYAAGAGLLLGRYLVTALVMPWVLKTAAAILASALGPSITAAYLGPALGAVFGSLTPLLFNPMTFLFAAAGLAVIAGTKAIVENWEQIKANFLPWISSVGLAINGLFEAIVAAFTGDKEKLLESTRQFIDNFNRALEGIFDIVIGTLNALTGSNIKFIGEARSEQTLSDAEHRYQDTVARNNGRTSAYGFTPNRADGFTSGLIGAVVREGQRMPAGAGIVVANSSEQILNRQQQAALNNVLASRGATNVTFGDIIIHSNAADPRKIADAVMAEIESRFNAYSRSRAVAGGVA